MSSVSFPASVALLIMFFFGLNLSETTLGDKKTKRIVQIIDVPVSLHAPMKWNGAVGSRCVRLVLPFDTSTSSSCPLLVRAPFPTLFGGSHNFRYGTDLKVVTLPLSPPVSGLEVGKIIAVFCEEISLEGFAIH